MQRRFGLLACVFAVSAASTIIWPHAMRIDAAPRKALAVRGRSRCNTPAPAENIRAAVQKKLAAARQQRGAAARLDISIPVQFIHITNGTQGQVTDQRRQDQLDVLNAAYTDFGITFVSAGPPIVQNNAQWYGMTPGSAAEVDCKTALHVDPETTLNFYTGGLGGSVLGWSTFPWELEADPDMDGVVILDESLPGGSAAPYNLGMTATHEIGHWLGLYHTFQGSCGPTGDEVDDTVAHSAANYGCPAPGRNGACNASQQAPIHNFMNYTDDACMTEFTPGQDTRATEMVTLYRPVLTGNPPPPCDCAMNCLATRLLVPLLPAKLLPQIRQLRDNLLSDSSDGRRLIRHYYDHSNALFRMLAADPRLAMRTGRMLLKVLPDDAAASGRVRLSAELYDESLVLLEHFASQADPTLSDALDDVRAILERNATVQDGVVTLEFRSRRTASAAALD